MKTFAVTVRATITKTIEVEAETEESAQEQAHEQFSVLCDGTDENYNEETLDVTEVK